MLPIPTSAQSLCLALTYHRLPGSSPTSSVPSPGRSPAAVRAATRSVSSPRIAAAVALPSRTVADTPPVCPTRPGGGRHGADRGHTLDPEGVSPRPSTAGGAMSERDDQAWQPGTPGVQDDGGTRRLPVQEPPGDTQGPPAEDWREQTTPGMTPI